MEKHTDIFKNLKKAKRKAFKHIFQLFYPRLIVLENLKAESISTGLKGELGRASIVCTDGYKGYSKLKEQVKEHQVYRTFDKKVLEKTFPWVHTAISNAKRAAAPYNLYRLMSSFVDNIKMVAAYKDEFFKNVVEPVSRNFEVRYKKGTFKSESVELDFHKKQLSLSEKNEYLVFTPRVEYDHNVSAVLNTTGNILVKNGDLITEYRRNFERHKKSSAESTTLHSAKRWFGRRVTFRVVP